MLSKFIRQNARGAEWLNEMKTKLLTTSCVLALILGGANSSFGSEDGMLMITDVTLVRPVCLAATVIGSAFFVVSLPIAAISRSTS